VVDGWRDRRRDGGVVLEIPGGRVIASGLSMPHSPRCYRGRLWLHNSGTGQFGSIDPRGGKFEPLTFCPGYLRGLAFVDVASATETHDGVPVLVVEGTIVSTKERAAEVPRLRFSIRNQNGQEVYAWTALPSRSVLAPGETLSFRSRLASPPAEGHDVLVRFFNRRDRVAGVQ